MGKFSKDNNVSDFFEKLKLDIEKERDKRNKKLGEFGEYANGEFKTGAIKIEFDNTEDSDPLKALRNKVIKVDDSNDVVSELVQTKDVSTDNDSETLLQKCKVYTFDEDGNDCTPQDTNLYELKSVAEILKNESQDAIDQLTKKYNITITDTTTVTDVKDDVFSNKSKTETEPAKDSRIKEFIDMVEDSKNEQDAKKEYEEIFEDNITDDSPGEIIEKTKDIPDISDIDSEQKFNVDSFKIQTKPTTLKFIPVKGEVGKKPKITLTSITGNIEIVNKENDESIQNQTATKLEANDFDDYSASNEINNFDELKTAVIKVSKQKRFRFFQIILSAISLAFLSAFLIPSISEKLTTEFKTSLLVLISVLSANVVINADVFVGFRDFISKFAKPDAALALAGISTISILLIHYIYNFTDYIYETFYIALSLSFVLFARAVLIFYYLSSKLSALKIISGKKPKNAVRLIDDQTVTFAMTKNSIDGDVLIAVPQKTGFIANFIKYFDYNTVLNGKFYYYQIFGILTAAILAVGGSVYFENIILGLSCFSVLSLVISLPLGFMINTLPIYSANKKLKKSGAMISGVEGAMQIENSNAALVYSSELFPSGSVVLKDMKILSDNSIDDTILKAASLTEAVGSTLAPIFKTIAKTNSAYVLPDSDTVKYEDRLGLSGWVDNEMLFIGNRTLLESHGIAVPDIEVDKQILKNGYFPVYLATVQKACALLVIKYIPDYSIAKALRTISSLGVTLLINNNDPNINEEMIADYFDIYEDTLKVVSNSGISLFNKTTPYVDSAAAPAVYKRNNLSLVKIMNSANAIKKSNSLLTVLYVVISILVATGFVYLTFSQKNSFPTTSKILLFEVISTVFAAVVYLFKKP